MASTGKPGIGFVIELTANGETHQASSDSAGHFTFQGLAPGSYGLSIIAQGHSITSPTPVMLSQHPASATLSVSAEGTLAVVFNRDQSNSDSSGKSGGEQLSSNAVSQIPLNKRDFSQLLLLAAGTATDTNGGSNYTAQFAINGQRGAEATFAMDGADSSDPELGGATFTNFNVDAVQEIQSSSGWMPAEIGRGGAGYTNVVTRSGTDGSAWIGLRVPAQLRTGCAQLLRSSHRR